MIVSDAVRTAIAQIKAAEAAAKLNEAQSPKKTTPPAKVAIDLSKPRTLYGSLLVPASSVRPRSAEGVGGHPQLQVLRSASSLAEALLSQLQAGDYLGVQDALLEVELDLELEGIRSVATQMRMSISDTKQALTHEHLNSIVSGFKANADFNTLKSEAFNTEFWHAAARARVHIYQLQGPLAELEAEHGKPMTLGAAMALSDLLAEGKIDKVVELGERMAKVVGSQANLPGSLLSTVEAAGVMKKLLLGAEQATTTQELVDVVVEAATLDLGGIADKFKEQFQDAVIAAQQRLKPAKPAELGRTRTPSKNEIAAWGDAELLGALQDWLSKADLTYPSQSAYLAEEEATQRGLLAPNEQGRVAQHLENQALAGLNEEVDNLREVIRNGDPNDYASVSDILLNRSLQQVDAAGVDPKDLPDPRLLKRLRNKGRLVNLRNTLSRAREAIDKGDLSRASLELKGAQQLLNKATSPKKSWLEFRQLKADLKGGERTPQGPSSITVAGRSFNFTSSQSAASFVAQMGRFFAAHSSDPSD